MPQPSHLSRPRQGPKQRPRSVPPRHGPHPQPRPSSASTDRPALVFFTLPRPAPLPRRPASAKKTSCHSPALASFFPDAGTCRAWRVCTDPRDDLPPKAASTTPSQGRAPSRATVLQNRYQIPCILGWPKLVHHVSCTQGGLELLREEIDGGFDLGVGFFAGEGAGGVAEVEGEGERFLPAPIWALRKVVTNSMPSSGSRAARLAAWRAARRSAQRAASATTRDRSRSMPGKRGTGAARRTG